MVRIRKKVEKKVELSAEAVEAAETKLLAGLLFECDDILIEEVKNRIRREGLSDQQSDDLLKRWKSLNWVLQRTSWGRRTLCTVQPPLMIEMAKRLSEAEVVKYAAKMEDNVFFRGTFTIYRAHFTLVMKALCRLEHDSPIDDLLLPLAGVTNGFNIESLVEVMLPVLDICYKDDRLRGIFRIVPEVLLECFVSRKMKVANRGLTGFLMPVPTDCDFGEFLRTLAWRCESAQRYFLRNGFWSAEDPREYVRSLPECWAKILMEAAIQCASGQSPAEALKAARAVIKASGNVREFDDISANWFYGYILYCNRRSGAAVRTMRSLIKYCSSHVTALSLMVWCHAGVNEDVVQFVEDCEGSLKSMSEAGGALIVATAKSVGAELPQLMKKSLKQAEGKDMPGYIAFEVLHALAPESETYRKKAEALNFKGFLPEGNVCAPKWERILDKLITIETAGGRNSESRVIYHVDCRDWSLQPRLVKVLASGALSKGRDIALSTFAKADIPGMTQQDKALAALVEVERDYFGTSSHLYGPRVIHALAGHPYVYDARDDNAHLEVESVPFELHVREKTRGDSEGFVIASNATKDFRKYDGYAICRKGEVITVMTVDPDAARAYSDLNELGLLPKEAAPKLKKLLGSLSRKTVVMSDLVNENIETVQGRSIPSFRFELAEQGGFAVKACVHPIANGTLSCVPGKGIEFLQTTSGGKPVQVRRDLKAESAAFKEAAALIGADALNREGTEWELDPVECLKTLDALRSLGTKVEIEWPEDAVYKVSNPPVDADAVSLNVHGIDHWLAVEGTVKINRSIKLSIAELLEKLRDSDVPGFILLGDNEYVAVSEALRRQLGLLEGVSDLKRGKLRVPRCAAGVVDDLSDAGVVVDADEAASDLMARIRSAADVDEEVPSQLQADLRGYQVDGFKWMSRLAAWDAGGILADDMGLGKTVQAIAFLLSRAKDGPSLVVVPAAVLLNWESELTRFAPGLRCIVFNRVDRDKAMDGLGAGDVMISTYGLLQTESEMFSSVDWNVVILDEAHYIKSKTTKTSKAAMLLRSRSRLLLTGTPLQNHLSELWNLSEFANPGLLGSYDHFVERFVLPVEKHRDKDRQHLLKRMISPFILRRTKTDVLDELPQKTEITLNVELSDAERALYESLREQASAKLETNEINSMQALAELMKLRQAACHPDLINPKLGIASSKTEAFLKLVDELVSNGHRALVFSQFTSHLALIRRELEARGIEYLYLDGSVPATERAKLTESFRLGKMPLFLISLKAGGVGLNLTAADYVIHLDPWWNPAVEDQASDRAYRIGQERPVTVYRLVAKNTIEEKILRLHDSKRSLADALLEGADMSSRLSKEALLELLASGSKM